MNTPLTTLDIGSLESHKLSTSLLPHIKELHCIKLYHPYQPHHLFDSHPSLQQLNLPLVLDTSESVIELFTILQSNNTLKTLRVEIKNIDVIDSMGTKPNNRISED